MRIKEDEELATAVGILLLGICIVASCFGYYAHLQDNYSWSNTPKVTQNETR
jgi:hypothetical protein